MYENVQEEIPDDNIYKEEQEKSHYQQQQQQQQHQHLLPNTTQDSIIIGPTPSTAPLTAHSLRPSSLDGAIQIHTLSC
ncbi:hypothetical protein E2C01_077898 [Portunus trituberculatus]|uniref:Uncharacterized protein n=1 Tax=Portunus trituberculatus TaxID=210409 RepID=A0A5B7ING3_PORTR|nr:hypothetical protein [Portunus trituberculatus]